MQKLDGSLSSFAGEIPTNGCRLIACSQRKVEKTCGFPVRTGSTVLAIYSSTAMAAAGGVSLPES
ncbi:Leucine-rich repeat transmembrane protein kinase family protein [Perilla frutescens var. frutescens]|nr:Leucine-rich repeat transmembrane protein kinase family protein [Perilla frutescens var. frutescens]